ncbi:MAG: hypothetical protein HQL98_15070 [Magnetococcales bacterium]|nr:hypothetical protein [Magnetococcales bacterium]
MMTTEKKSGDSGKKSEGASGWIILLIILAALGLSGFYAINDYASSTGAVLKRTNANAEQFETVFRDLLQARMRAMNLASEVMLQSRVTVEAFAKKDRDALIARIEPFFQVLRKDHGVAQLNFWHAPATLFYRAGSPTEYGQDLSKFRKSIVAANERKQKILAVETGLGGVIAVRAITPVTHEDKLVGVLEYASDFNIPLERASTVTGLKWAIGLMKEVSDRVERPIDNKNDAVKGTDVYYIYSDNTAGEMMRALNFDPRAKDSSLDKSGKKTVFVKTFPLVNFSGVPTIVISTMLDLTEVYGDLFQGVAIKAVILFLVIAVGGTVGYMQLGQMRAGFFGVMSRQKKELEDRAVMCDAAMAKLKEVDLIKRGFFTNLVTALNEPLLSVSGQLQSLMPTVDTVAKGELPLPEQRQILRERFEFSMHKTARLSRLVADYQQLELFRQKLVKAENPLVSVADVTALVIAEDMASLRRLPQLKIASTVTADMPQIRADADLLRRAISGLVGYAAHQSGSGNITVACRHDRDGGWLNLSITGSAFANAGVPNEAMIDESRQFLSRIGNVSNATETNTAPLIAVVLSRVILEFYGGSLEVSTSEPGFVLRLPVTV